MAGRGVTQNQKNRMAGHMEEFGKGSSRIAVSVKVSHLRGDRAGNLHGLRCTVKGSEAALLLLVWQAGGFSGTGVLSGLSERSSQLYTGMWNAVVRRKSKRSHS